MGLFDGYVPSKKLEELSEDVLKKLEKLDKVIKNSKTDEAVPVSRIIAAHGEDLVDLVDRLSKHLEENPPSWGSIWSNSKFIYGIAIEIYQLINTMADEVTDEDMSEDKKKEVLKQLGQNLVWFIWSTMDPLRKVTWLPQFIERAIVKWIAGQALEFAADLFAPKEEKLKAGADLDAASKPSVIQLKAF